MAVIKCKMCGGDLVLVEGQSVAECEYCGSRQTVPSADSEKKLTLFARANRLRAACEFDKAAGIYEAIVADFPAEAEAYWGLVLCKYGIEYVDDPATGKKIPTCHRSSFDSVLEDENFEQAVENADLVAQKVYREEAKEFERIRKGILEVSSTEKPYDIFLCYKETDEKGDRTLDSVLAQDLYTALTEKGYRVFFSRITLRDKLGQAYEPYIFAALNSAKVMLAVGTCYEYYNAVWVKNEWSRYLKICEADKSKHLIPCYRDLDPEDMPREFSHLQGADLGKMGAIQDILFNMGKYIPLKKETVIPEKILVGNAGGNNKIASLLDRGNMALEDGDWAKADSFFEDVLNNDSKNAQAYIGKTLAQEKCRTLDALIRKRKEATQENRTGKLSLERDTTHIEQAAQKYSIPGYVEPDSIWELYNFDLSYPSGVSHRKRQYNEEESWWENHRWLSRAEKFASGAVAQTLQDARAQLLACLSDRVRRAEVAEKNAADKLSSEYAAHITQADAKAEKKYQDGLARREGDYESWLGEAKTETNPHALQELASRFDGLGDFRDSRNLAEQCRKRSDEEQAKIDAEIKRKRMVAEQERKARQKKNKTLAILAAAAALVVIIAAVVVTQVIIPGNRYKAAEALLAEGHYEEAAAKFEALGSYRDSETAKTYLNGILLLTWGENRELDNPDAKELLKQIAEKNAKETVPETTNPHDATVAAPAPAETEQVKAPEIVLPEFTSEELFALECFRGAQAIFEGLGDYRDSAAMLLAAREAAQGMEADLAQRIEDTRTAAYAQAEELVRCRSYARAAMAFYSLGDYQDARQRSMEIWNTVAQRDTISAGGSHTVGLKADGSVVAVGSNNYGQCKVSDWRDIVAISTGYYHTVGLKADGSVVAVGYNEYGQCDVSGWRDIVAISAGYYHTVGLKADGSVVVVGKNDGGQCEVSDWRDIVAISAGGLYTTVGLKADGTVVAVGDNAYGRCDVSNWTDIVAISAGGAHTVGLKADGSVVAVGSNNYGQCDVSDWRDIMAISAGGAAHTVGLKADGSVVAVGWNHYGQCDVSDWRDIVAISARGIHTVGLKADGSVVAVGSNDDGQCDVSDWTDIKLPK